MDAIRYPGRELTVRSILVGTNRADEHGNPQFTTVAEPYCRPEGSLQAFAPFTRRHLARRRLRTRLRMISQIIQQSFRCDKIGSTKAFREPTVDRSEAGKGVGCAALAAQ